MVAFELVTLVHVSDELPQVGGQQLIMSATMWVSLAMTLVVVTRTAGTTHSPIHGSPVRAFPTSVRFSILLQGLLVALASSCRLLSSLSRIGLQGCIAQPKAESDFDKQAFTLLKVAGP